MSPQPRITAGDRAAAAFDAMLTHVTGCAQCRAIRLRQAPAPTENGVCPHGNHLVHAHRTARRQVREENR
jgi:hypothetical protein